jgi:hypothetical protein
MIENKGFYFPIILKTLWATIVRFVLWTHLLMHLIWSVSVSVSVSVTLPRQVATSR